MRRGKKSLYLEYLQLLYFALISRLRGALPNFSKNCHKKSPSWLVVNLKNQGWISADKLKQ